MTSVTVFIHRLGTKGFASDYLAFKKKKKTYKAFKSNTKFFLMVMLYINPLPDGERLSVLLYGYLRRFYSV